MLRAYTALLLYTARYLYSTLPIQHATYTAPYLYSTLPIQHATYTTRYLYNTLPILAHYLYNTLLAYTRVLRKQRTS